MRHVMNISLPPEKFNDAVRDGSAGEKIGRILESIQPEAAYFTTVDGQRGGFLVVDIASASDIPKLAEPWFLNFDASIEIHPVMTPEDLQRAGLDELGKTWG